MPAFNGGNGSACGAGGSSFARIALSASSHGACGKGSKSSVRRSNWNERADLVIGKVERHNRPDMGREGPGRDP